MDSFNIPSDEEEDALLFNVLRFYEESEKNEGKTRMGMTLWEQTIGKKGCVTQRHV